MENVLKVVKTYLLYITSAFGASLAIKANVGVSSFNSMNVAISNAAEVKIGTITIVINLLFLLIYMKLTAMKKKKTYIIQFLTIVMFGAVINMFTYNLLAALNTTDYGVRLALISIGTIISGLSIGLIVHYDVITLPVEGCCLELSKVSTYSFSRYRYFVDLFSVVISMLISISFRLPLFVREGTIISMLLLTASMTLIQSRVKQKPKTLKTI